MLYPQYALGIDGRVPYGEIESDGCCPPEVCEITRDSIVCAMVDLLPSGPLWDKSKELALASKGWCEPVKGCVEERCATLVQHAIYTGDKLYYYINSALWPALREASPYTAYTTMDEWLDRLGWVDCYNTFCRDKRLGDLTPYEVIGPCGPEYCPPTFGEKLSRIYKRGVIVALWRMSQGAIHNIDSLNFILSSLYSELVVDPSSGPGTGIEPRLILQPTSDYAPIVQKEACPRSDTTILQAQEQVKLFLTPAEGLCIGGPQRAYPLTLAAHCILMSIMPTCCTIRLVRKP